MTGTGSRADSADLDAIRTLIARLGVKPEELLGGPTSAVVAPTFDEYIKRVSQAVTPSTHRAYETYWRRVSEAWGQRRLDEPAPVEIAQLAEHMKTQIAVRRNSRGGRSASEHLIGALRCLYRYAVADGIIREADNPATRVPKPRRLASSRRALRLPQLAEINEVAATTGNDPQLDSMLLRLHEETACRRGGALSLRRRDLDVEQCLVWLREKGETSRWQPISPTLMRTLVGHNHERAAGAEDAQLLRYRNGDGLTSRRYDHLWVRLGKHLPWVAAQHVSTHWLRHTTLTWVERHFSFAIARAYAGHTEGRSEKAATSTYVRADLYEVATALAALVGERHPLALDGPLTEPMPLPAV